MKPIFLVLTNSLSASISASTPIPPPDWELVIDKIADDIIKERSVNRYDTL